MEAIHEGYGSITSMNPLFYTSKPTKELLNCPYFKKDFGKFVTFF